MVALLRLHRECRQAQLEAGRLRAAAERSAHLDVRMDDALEEASLAADRLYREHDDFVKLSKRHTARDSYLRGYRNFFVSVAVFPILLGLLQVTSAHCVSHHRASIRASIYLQPSIRNPHPQSASATRRPAIVLIVLIWCPPAGPY